MEMKILSASVTVDYRWRTSKDNYSVCEQPPGWTQFDDGASDNPFLVVSAGANRTFDLSVGNLIRPGEHDYRGRSIRVSLQLTGLKEVIARTLAIRFAEDTGKLAGQIAFCLSENAGDKDFGYDINAAKLSGVLMQENAPEVSNTFNEGFEVEYPFSGQEPTSAGSENLSKVVDVLKRSMLRDAARGIPILICKFPDENLLSDARRTHGFIFHDSEPVPRLPRRDSLRIWRRRPIQGVAVLLVLCVFLALLMNRQKKKSRSRR